MIIKKRVRIFLLLKAFLSLLIIVVLFTTLNRLNNIVGEELPQEIAGLNRSLYIKYLSDLTLYYDEILTQSARNYAFTEDLKWKERYKVFELRLQEIIHQGMAIGTPKDSLNFVRLSQVNDELVETEYKSFSLSDNHLSSKAIRVLEEESYWNLKKNYLESLNDYVESKDIEIKAILTNIHGLVARHSQQENEMVWQLKISFIIYILILLAISWTFSFVFFKQTINQLLKLKFGAERIKKGDFDFSIHMNSKDEFQELGDSFNKMAEQLKVMTKKINENLLRKELANQRNTFSRELHDRLGIIISSLKLQIERLSTISDNQKIKNIYSNSHQLLNEAYSQIRELADNALPEDILKVGIKQALSKFFSRMEMIFSIPIKFITNMKEEDLDLKRKASLYALIRELVNNSIKHSKCQKINVQLIQHYDHFIFMLEDDGIGFDYNDPSNRKGKGLSNVQERVKQMNGNFFIDSNQAHGITVTIEIPITISVINETN